MERMKHIASGGWWKADGGSGYVHASEGILSHFQDNPGLRRRLGLNSKETEHPGMMS